MRPRQNINPVDTCNQNDGNLVVFIRFRQNSKPTIVVPFGDEQNEGQHGDSGRRCPSTDRICHKPMNEAKHEGDRGPSDRRQFSKTSSSKPTC